MGHYYTTLHTALVLLWCVRFSLCPQGSLCASAAAAALSAAHYLMDQCLTLFTTYLLSRCNLMPYLLPLLASSFTFLCQASICARLLSSTLSRYPLTP